MKQRMAPSLGRRWRESTGLIKEPEFSLQYISNLDCQSFSAALHLVFKREGGRIPLTPLKLAGRKALGHSSCADLFSDNLTAWRKG